MWTFPTYRTSVTPYHKIFTLNPFQLDITTSLKDIEMTKKNGSTG